MMFTTVSAGPLVTGLTKFGAGHEAMTSFVGCTIGLVSDVVGDSAPARSSRSKHQFRHAGFPLMQRGGTFSRAGRELVT